MPRASKKVFILAPTANDSQIACEVLNQAGLLAESSAGVEELCKDIESGCGAVIISEESLTLEAIALLHSSLEKQETWSDLPIILLTSADVIQATELFSNSGNISLLERPFSQLTLIRSVQVALRARSRQYQVRELLEALQKSKDDADRANMAKTEFLANMSHEIRTPIGAIMGFIDLIRNQKNSEKEAARYMEIIERNSNQLLSLIDDILDLSKVESGKMTIEKIEISTNDIFAEIASMMSLRAQKKGLAFITHVTGKIPDRIITDSMRLKQILTNVIGNAIKFTSHGSVEFSIAFKDDAFEFLVKDTGLGISIQQAEKLFKPFSQADSSTTRKFGGTGLGLVLSRRLSQALGGDLNLRSSELDKGSVFEIKIKPELLQNFKWIGKENLSFEISSKKENNSAAILEGLRVLLVEDSPDNQVLIETYLRKTGAQITIRSNGQEGVATALGEFNHDVVLMDVQMPLMDGHEAVKILRQKNYTKPIIALTAHAMQEEKLRCFASGFSDYLTKPIQRDVLVQTLSKFVPLNN